MLRQLKAVIDLNAEHVCLAVLQQTIPLCFLPSGHVAIDVSDFGEHGFEFLHGLQTPEFSESEFRIPVGCGSSFNRFCDVVAQQRPSQFDQWPEEMVPRKPWTSAHRKQRVVNTKKAPRNWQALPDKVKQVQDLVVQEELVHPSPRVLLLSPPSTEQLEALWRQRHSTWQEAWRFALDDCDVSGAH